MKKIIIFLLFICIYGCEKDVESDDYFYAICNSGYQELLNEESFPHLLYESPMYIQYFTYSDSIKILNKSFKLPEEKVNTLIDTNTFWDLKKINKFTIITKEKTRELSKQNYDAFKHKIGKGFVILSKPLFDEKKQYALLKELKVYSFEEINSSSINRYLIFKRENGRWRYINQRIID